MMHLASLVSSVGLLFEFGGVVMFTIDLFPEYRAHRARQQAEAVLPIVERYALRGLAADQGAALPPGYSLDLTRLGPKRLEHLLRFAALTDVEAEELHRLTLAAFRAVFPLKVAASRSTGSGKELSWIAGVFGGLTYYGEAKERAVPHRWRPPIYMAAALVAAGFLGQMAGLWISSSV